MSHAKPIGNPRWTRSAALSIALVVLSGISTVAVSTQLTADTTLLLYPSMVTALLFYFFVKFLKKQVGDNLFCDLGFLYMGFAVAYTLIPALTFILVDTNNFLGKMGKLLPTQIELAIHLWRHVLFLFGFGAGYLVLRGRKVLSVRTDEATKKTDNLTILIMVGATLVAILCLGLLSAPVHEYMDNYTRYDHLSWLPRKFISVCVRFKLGMYAVLITFLFRNFSRLKYLIPVIIASICLYELVFSYGSRIESLITVLLVLCSYTLYIKRVTLKQGMALFLVIGIFFTGVESVRANGFELSEAKSSVSVGGLGPASEFGAVYFTGFHLYSERTRGTLAPRELPMFFNDFISLVTFADFNRWNPQFWYFNNYFPDSVVPPETMGPIAESALWGGEIDLLLRSIINGLFFAYLVRWFAKRSHQWWAVTVYIYCCATSIMTLKYSIFYVLSPIVKTLIPTILIVQLIRKMIQGYQGVQAKRIYPPPHSPHVR